MPQSQRLRHLLERIRILEKHFLPMAPQFYAMGQYSPQEEDHARAYVLLVHAELESYFEDRVRDVIARAHGQWQQTSTCTKTLDRLILCHVESKAKTPWERRRSIAASSPVVQAAVNFYASVIKDNHGIKETNLLSLLFPIGFDQSALDSTWLATMDSFGATRGKYAHTTQFKTQQPVDPKDAYLTVWNEIVPPIKKLDLRITRLS